ncbi:hypothetical protein NC652_024011 [Populus alba x Populus x berolinensis]|uniref:Uncharacterized protein n=1 Tax=Populus alba x Populus x berolinensis TaxID=444605 RepID=A0AAD6MHT9_9ROSI|nr:hypothetical protein NC652_024011 [Populus alba x Populus x berolinensis]KAJ6985826.1 hypothetical protein NC653_023687 [Populus alba x Populus x berolinensis]
MMTRSTVVLMVVMKTTTTMEALLRLVGKMLTKRLMRIWRRELKTSLLRLIMDGGKKC